jgi:tetratricopeptide (TPR) repeat protein
MWSRVSAVLRLGFTKGIHYDPFVVHHLRAMHMKSHFSLPFALLAFVVAPPAHARAEAGAQVDNVELKTLAGGKASLLSSKVKANVFVFFRTGQDRSLDALKQMAGCEKELAGKSIYWTAVVSSTEPIADVQAVVKESGITMPVLLDEGDELYNRLGIRLHPIIGIADSKGVLHALEPYRQIDYCEVVKTRIKILLGEATQAQLDKVTNPEKSPLPGADPMKKAMRDVNMARRLYEIGQYADSIKFAQRALEVAPVAHAYSVLGQSYSKLGKCPEAVKAFDQAAKLDAKEAAIDRGTCK